MIEETRHDTFESAERQHWDAVSSEWEADKMRILTALSGANASEAATESFLPRKEQTRRLFQFLSFIPASNSPRVKREACCVKR